MLFLKKGLLVVKQSIGPNILGTDDDICNDVMWLLCINSTIVYTCYCITSASAQFGPFLFG